MEPGQSVGEYFINQASFRDFYCCKHLVDIIHFW